MPLPARLLSLADGAIRIAFGDCSGAFLKSLVWVTLVVAMRPDFGLPLRLCLLSEIHQNFPSLASSQLKQRRLRVDGNAYLS
jgi:hypothetical protein